MIVGYRLFVDHDGHVADLCPACALTDALTMRVNRKLLVTLVREQYWRHGHTAPQARAYCALHGITRSVRYWMEQLLVSGLARFGDEGEGEYSPISTYAEDTYDRLVCEHGHPILLPPICVKLNPQEYGVETCQCEDCLGEIGPNWERLSEGDPLIVDRTVAYITSQYNVRMWSEGHDSLYVYRRPMRLAGWAKGSAVCQFLSLLWHSEGVICPSLEITWPRDQTKPEALRDITFQGAWERFACLDQEVAG